MYTLGKDCRLTSRAPPWTSLQSMNHDSVLSTQTSLAMNPDTKSRPLLAVSRIPREDNDGLLNSPLRKLNKIRGYNTMRSFRTADQ